MAFSKDTAFEFLRRAHADGRLGHAYLIAGPNGSGKREFALDLAALVTGRTAAEVLTAPEVHSIEPESKLRRIVVDQIRELEHLLQLKSSGTGRKVAMIFDADRLQPQASNAFLKTLEEPPSNSLLLLITNYPEMLLDTIRSRCIRVVLHRVGVDAPDEDERAVLDMLNDFYQRGVFDLGATFVLVRDFLDVLAAAKAKLAGHFGEELKREEAHYAKTTDSSWLDEREDYYKVLVEARYQLVRGRLIEVLDRWFGDVLRHRCAPGTRLDFDAYAETTGKLAAAMDFPLLLGMSDLIDQIRENLGRNVQETLAVEVGFLKIFCRS